MDFTLILFQLLILFFVLLCGVYARKRAFIDWQSTKSLSKLLVNVTTPLLIIGSFQIDYNPEKLAMGGKIFLISAAYHAAMSALAAFLFRREKNTDSRNVLGLVTIFGNCAFLGYPVLEAVFGEYGRFYGVFFTLFFNLYMYSFGVWFINRGKKRADIKLKNLLFNSCTVSAVIAITLYLFQVRFPKIAVDAINTVGNMTFPLSMLIIGSLVATLDLKKTLTSFYPYFYCFLKLLIVPAAVLGISWLSGLDRTLAMVLVIMSAVPGATNSAIFAELYDSDSSLGAQTVGMSTLMSVLTLPAVIYFANMIL